MIGYVALGLFGVFLLFVSITGILKKPDPEIIVPYRSYEIFQYTNSKGIPTISIAQK